MPLRENGTRPQLHSSDLPSHDRKRFLVPTAEVEERIFPLPHAWRVMGTSQSGMATESLKFAHRSRGMRDHAFIVNSAITKPNNATSM